MYCFEKLGHPVQRPGETCRVCPLVQYSGCDEDVRRSGTAWLVCRCLLPQAISALIRLLASYSIYSIEMLTLFKYMRTKVILFFLDNAFADLDSVFLQLDFPSPQVKHMLVDFSENQLVDAHKSVEKKKVDLQ